MESKYLKYVEINNTGKTKKFEIYNKNSNELLGKVYWYAHWRKYIFSPSPKELIFDVTCMFDIINFIDNLMEERRKAKYGI